MYKGKERGTAVSTAMCKTDGVTVWVSISANGVGDLVKLAGIINAENPRKILILHAIPTKKCLKCLHCFSMRIIPNTLPM